MNSILTASNENQGCKQLAPSLARPKPECVHAGADSEAPLAPFGGVQAASSPIGCTPQLAPPRRVGESMRILLSERTSQALAATGESFFRIVAMGTHPDQPGRWVIGLRPVSPEMAQEIEGILRGTHKATPIRHAKAAQDSPACHPSPGQLDAAQGNVAPSSALPGQDPPPGRKESFPHPSKGRSGQGI